MSPFARKRMRLRGLLRKEVLQIRRDPSSIALAIVMPLVLLFLFGYGVSLDPRDVPVAMVMDDHGPLARDLAARFELGRYIRPIHVVSWPIAEAMLADHRVAAAVKIPSTLSQRLAAGQAVVQVVVNGTNSNQARLIQGYVEGAVEAWSRQREARGLPIRTPAVRVLPRIWFNESLNSTDYLVPGLVALVMTLIGVLLTALVVAREWERGTMEAILATPLRAGEILIGKTLPYFGMGMLGLALSVGMGVLLFGVPFRGSVGVLLGLSSLFLLASLGLGLVISATAKVQFVAAQVALMVGFLPAFFLSGLLFDLESTPAAVRALSHIIPARYFISAAQTLFLAGDVWSLLARDAAALAVMATVLLVLARRRLSKRLEG